MVCEITKCRVKSQLQKQNKEIFLATISIKKVLYNITTVQNLNYLR